MLSEYIIKSCWRQLSYCGLHLHAISEFEKNPMRFAVFWRISVRFCCFRTPLTPPSSNDFYLTARSFFQFAKGKISCTAVPAFQLGPYSTHNFFKICKYQTLSRKLANSRAENNGRSTDTVRAWSWTWPVKLRSCQSFWLVIFEYKHFIFHTVVA